MTSHRGLYCKTLSSFHFVLANKWVEYHCNGYVHWDTRYDLRKGGWAAVGTERASSETVSHSPARPRQHSAAGPKTMSLPSRSCSYWLHSALLPARAHQQAAADWDTGTSNGILTGSSADYSKTTFLVGHFIIIIIQNHPTSALWSNEVLIHTNITS